MSPIQAHQMIYCMRQAVIAGTGQEEIGDKFPSPPFPPIAGKTGTTDDSTDAWFVGFTPELLMVCYIGFDTPRSLGPKMTGGRVAGPIWGKIFKRVHDLREDWKLSFDPPNGIETADICGDTGKRASELCGRWDHGPIYRGVPYLKGEAPREVCDGVPRRPIIAAGSESGGFVGGGSEEAPPFGFTR
jgi:penicillin-binding protein 1A